MKEFKKIAFPFLVIAVFVSGTSLQAAQMFRTGEKHTQASTNKIKQYSPKLKYLSADIKKQLEQAKQDQSPKIDVRDYDTFCDAIEYKDYEYVKRAVDAGINLNVNACAYGFSPLLYATKLEDFSMVNLLVVSGAKVNGKSEETQTTPLMEAAVKNNKRIAEYLIDNGADLNIQDQSGKTALIRTIENNSVVVFLSLISAGANLNIQDKNGNTAAMIAILNDKMEMLEDLISAGADLDIQNKDGNRVLGYYLEDKTNNLDHQMVKTLVSAVKDINMRDKIGATYLMLAAHRGDLWVVKYLISQGADASIKTEGGKAGALADGYTAFTIAACFGHLEIAKYLVKFDKDFDVNLMCSGAKIERTALMWAAVNGHLHVVKYLVEDLKADTSLKDEHGRTALDLAREYNEKEVVEYLENK